MTLTDLQKRKLTRFFTVYDQNNDGVIERIDYIMLADNISTAKGFDLESPLSSRLRECMLRVWENLEHIADKNHDGSVTLAEFLAYRDQLHQDEVKYNDLVTAGLTIFDVMDDNRDGQIDLNEFKLFYSFFQLDESLAEEVFAELDVDQTGYLTRDEIQNYSREFNLGDDPEAIGNKLFGPY
jgi:Ca2+-binding EF-hand superfamily protein